MDLSRPDNTGSPEDSLREVITAIAALHGDLEALSRTPRAGDNAFGKAEAAALASVLDARVPALHAAYDAYVDAVLRDERKKITCRKGCSACCRHYVGSVEPFELVALERRLRLRDDYPELVYASHKRNLAFRGLLDEEAASTKKPEEAEDRALYRYFLRGAPCPFLAPDGGCGVYEWRPMSCRMFFAESPPRFCEGKALSSPWNRNFQVELPQAAEEALARCSRLLDGLELPEDLFGGFVAVNALFARFADDGAGNAPEAAGGESP